MKETRITEQSSPYRHLERMPVEELTASINKEDKTVAFAVEKALPQLNRLIREIVRRLEEGGRLFYLGAGSGGRLSVLDVIELPTTYGVPEGMVEAILAGGKERLVEALEEMEDDRESAWRMLQEASVSQKDIVVGISASGTTPFVVSGLKSCREHGIATGCIAGNPDSPMARYADFPIEVITGPEFLTGSTRMKCGTAQKMIFDMISTTVMIRLGRVEDNRMVNVRLINDKTTGRVARMLMEKAGLDDFEQARALLLEHGNLRDALKNLLAGR